jgi:hypothetical protein
MTPMTVGSGRSRPMRDEFPTGTHRCRLSEEFHSLLGRRVCVYRERRTLPQKLWLSFEAPFWTLSFVNSNTWHLSCNNFNLNFIFGNVCLCVCFCAFSLRRESPIWYWEINPLFLRWFCHNVVASKLLWARRRELGPQDTWWLWSSPEPGGGSRCHGTRGRTWAPILSFVLT